MPFSPYVGLVTYGSVTMVDRSYLIVGANSAFSVLGGTFKMIGIGIDERDEYGFLVGAFIIGTEGSHIQVVRGSMVIEKRLRLSLLEFATVSVTLGDLILRDGSELFAYGGTVILYSGNMIFQNQSTLGIYENSTLAIRGNLQVSQSGFLNVTSSLLQVYGNVVMQENCLMTMQNSSMQIVGGSISLSSDSKIVLKRNSTLVGTGEISGNIKIESGSSIQYGMFGNGSVVPTNLSITGLTTTNSSSYGLVLTPDKYGQIVSSTFVNASYVDLGGNLVVVIDRNVDELLRNGSISTLFPFIQSANPINGSFSSVSVTVQRGADGVDYSDCYKVTQTASRTLSVLFDSTAGNGKCGAKAGSPSSSPSVSGGASFESGGSVGVAVGVTIGVAAALLVVAGLAVWKVPSLRKRFLPGQQASYELKQMHQRLVQDKASQAAAPLIATAKSVPARAWTPGTKPDAAVV